MKVNENNTEYLIRKFSELEQRLIESERYGRQTDITIDNLEMQLNAEREAKMALAAENGQMLRLLTDISENHDEYVNQDEYLYAGVPMDYVSEINSYVSRDVEAENPFKETDALLAEVRAQGVEMAVDVVKQCYDNICAGGLQENREYEESIVQPHLDGIDDELNEIIAQLRKGVQS
jgi:vacuolar-type H+-ATPase subunit I/STV1